MSSSVACHPTHSPKALNAARDRRHAHSYHERLEVHVRFISRQTRRSGARYRQPTYADYKNWADEEVGFKTTAIAFGRDLAERGYKKVKVHGARGFAGLKPRPEVF